MHDLIRRGKVIYWGFSEWPVEQIEKGLQICGTQRLEKPKSSQPQYNMLQRGIETQVMPLCHKMRGIYLVLREWQARREEAEARRRCCSAQEGLRPQEMSA